MLPGGWGLLPCYLVGGGCCHATWRVGAAAMLPDMWGLLPCYLAGGGCCHVTWRVGAAAMLPGVWGLACGGWQAGHVRPCAPAAVCRAAPPPSLGPGFRAYKPSFGGLRAEEVRFLGICFGVLGGFGGFRVLINNNNNRRLVTLAEHTSDHGRQTNSSTEEKGEQV